MKKVVCRQDQERDIHYTTIHKHAIDGKHHLGFKFQKTISSIPCFQPLFASWEN